MRLSVRLLLVCCVSFLVDNHGRLSGVRGARQERNHTKPFFSSFFARLRRLKGNTTLLPSRMRRISVSQTQRRKYRPVARSCARNEGIFGVQNTLRKYVIPSGELGRVHPCLRRRRRWGQSWNCAGGSRSSPTRPVKRGALCSLCWIIQRGGAVARVAFVSLLVFLIPHRASRAKGRRGQQVDASTGRPRRLASGGPPDEESGGFMGGGPGAGPAVGGDPEGILAPDEGGGRPPPDADEAGLQPLQVLQVRAAPRNEDSDSGLSLNESTGSTPSLNSISSGFSSMSLSSGGNAVGLPAHGPLANVDLGRLLQQSLERYDEIQEAVAIVCAVGCCLSLCLTFTVVLFLLRH